MRVRFVEGPLDGEVRDIQVELVDGSVIELPSGAEQDDPTIPGDETVISYIYEGNGNARFVGGILPE